MNKQEKRETLERALGRLAKLYTPFPDWAVFLPQIAQTLAEQMVIECEVEHKQLWPMARGIRTSICSGGQTIVLRYGKPIGIPGKALAIIIPLEEE